MIFNVIDIKENPDGSADLEIEMDEEAKVFFLNAGVNAVLRKAIDEYKEEK